MRTLTTIRNTHAVGLGLGSLGHGFRSQDNTIAPGGFFGPHALDVFAKLDDQTVMHHSVDRRRGGEGILEDLIPLGEDEVGGDDHAAPFVPFGQKSKQNFHFLAALLHVTQIVENDDGEAVKAAQAQHSNMQLKG